MAQAAQTPEQASIADGATSTFPISFTFASTAEVRVTVDVGAGPVLKAEGLDYVVSGANVIFQPGRLPANSARVARFRSTAVAQPEPFGDQATFRPVANEVAFDKLTRIAQENRARVARGVQAPIGEAGPELQPQAQRDGGLAKFEGGAIRAFLPGLGEVIARDRGTGQLIGIPPSFSVDVDVLSFPTRLAASLTEISPGAAFLRTAGYQTPGDGGGALYKRVLAEPTHPGKFQSGDGDWWELAPQIVTPQMFGAAGNGAIDDTAAFNRAFEYLTALDGGTLDLMGLRYYCAQGAVAGVAWVLPNFASRIRITSGWVTVGGDIALCRGAAGATSITYVQFDSLFIDHSGATTAGRALFDASLFSFCTWRDVWVYNANASKTVFIYCASNGAVGPYYNKVLNCYGGPVYCGVWLAGGDVVHTVNDWIIDGCRFQPLAGFYGVINGQENQRNIIRNNSFEALHGGGTGVSDDGYSTQILGNRFEGMGTGIAYGANAAGWNDDGNYLNSCLVDRTWAGASRARGKLTGDIDTNTGALRDSLLAGVFRLLGDPGFPAIGASEAVAFSSAVNGATIAGKGSTNDLTLVNGDGLPAIEVPTGTQNVRVRGELRPQSLYFNDGGTFIEVTIGDPDSGGTGLRALCIAN